MPRFHAGSTPRRALPACLSLALAFLLALGGAVALAAELVAPELPTRKPVQPQRVSQAGAEKPGIGGTGDAVRKGPGISGTGQPARQGPGIGGTGDVASGPGIGGTGIVGTITAFGSIFVNGYEIDYPEDIAVGYKGGTEGVSALKVGQVVAVEADGEGEGTRLKARSIAVRYQVAGPVERINAKSNSVIVLGQKVDMAAIGDRTDISMLKLGDNIDVSGLRRDDGVISASRIDRSRPSDPALLRGTVMAVDEAGFTVDGLRVNAPADERPEGISVGRDVRVIGAPLNGSLRGRRFDLAPARPFGGRVDRLSLQGYARRSRRGGYTVDGIPVSSPPPGSRFETGERFIMNGTVNRRGVFAPRTIRPSRIRRIRQNRLRNKIRRQDAVPGIWRRAPAGPPHRVWRQRPPPRAVPRPPARPRIRRDAPARRMRW